MHSTTMKQQLILSLLEMGSELGLDNISISMLAQKNGITKASVFHHFASRQAMVEELFSYCNTLAYKQVGTINLNGKATEVLTRAMDHWHDTYSEEPMNWFYRIIESEKLTHPEAGRISSTLHEMLVGQTTILLETLSESGRLDIEELDLAVLTFSSTAKHFLSLVLFGNEEESAWQEERFIAQFCSLYRGQ